ncbi:aldehyde dehydrogenase family protein [Nocardia sp. NPDC049220]|uniref:aldehyde dehydrogenase family protein n=1 Tax=Nocardia sp. NPDC049220 TaxID=3155273 RepID=UPI0033E402B2
MTTAPTVTLTGVNLIGNDDVAAAGPAFRATDPASGVALEPVYHQASAADIDRATTLAWAAFTTFRQTTSEQRAAFLDSIAEEIEALGSTLTERVHAETGIPTARILGETGRTTGQLRMFADVVREGSWTHARLDTGDPDRAPLPKPDLRQREVPVGPVAVFAASNFPLAFSVAGGDTASALAAGAPVIVKGPWGQVLICTIGYATTGWFGYVTYGSRPTIRRTAEHRWVTAVIVRLCPPRDLGSEAVDEFGHLLYPTAVEKRDRKTALERAAGPLTPPSNADRTTRKSVEQAAEQAAEKVASRRARLGVDPSKPRMTDPYTDENETTAARDDSAPEPTNSSAPEWERHMPPPGHNYSQRHRRDRGFER